MDFIVSSVLVHFLFAALFLLTKRQRREYDLYALLFLAALIVPQAVQYFILKSLWDETTSFLLLGFPLLFPPLLFIYLTSVLDDSFHFEKTGLFHFVPFILFCAAMRVYTFLYGMPELLPDSVPDQPDIMFLVLGIISGLGISASHIIYLRIMFKRLKQHRQEMKNSFSFDEIRINLLWLNWLIGGFALFYIIVFCAEVIRPLLTGRGLYHHELVRGTALTLFTFYFSFFAMKQRPLKEEKPSSKKYAKSGLKAEDAQRYLEVIERYMVNERPYLESELTIQDLSKALEIPKHYIAQVINEKLGKNFYTFVNDFRLSYCRRLLTEDEYKDYTILRIALESGFNSKSTFNSVFKKSEEMTPTEYRNQNV